MIRNGFTLIEMLVVIVIISILGAISYPQIIQKVAKARQVSTQSQIDIFSAALDNYYLDCHSYPSTQQGLMALWQKPTAAPVPESWDGPYVKKNIPADAWGHPYQYQSPGTHNPASFDLVSLGRDGKPGGDGFDQDIQNWSNLHTAN